MTPKTLDQQQLAFDKPPIRAGTIVTCPNCNKWLATVILTIKPDVIVSSRHFESIKPQVIANSVPTYSHCCKKPWWYGGILHTTEGWKP